MSLLPKIIDYKKLFCEASRRKISLRDIKSQAADTQSPDDFFKFFDQGLNVIAEIKKASPSAGVFFEDYKPLDIAEQYLEAGAKAISILTDEKFFQGTLQDVTDLKVHWAKANVVGLPILRKDFTVHEYNVYETRVSGADALLLIAAVLDDFQLRDYQQLAQELGLFALVETHNESEMERALRLNLTAVGINNRNLDTLTTDTQTSPKLREFALSHLQKHPFFKTPQTWISESGLKTQNDLKSLNMQGFQGFLIGESFLKSKHPGNGLRKILGLEPNR